jgi:hypothetical protein
MKIRRLIPLGLLFMPLLALAESVRSLEDLLGDRNRGLLKIFDLVVKVLIGAALVLFLYGVVKYISSGDNEEERKKGKDLIIYGIIGLFVMVSVWGLVNILAGTFELGTENIVGKGTHKSVLPW